MGKGKGRRRRQANYLAAHGQDHVLVPPPPPKATDASCVPSKLRRIMNFMQSPSSSGIQSSHVRSSTAKNESKAPESRKIVSKKEHKVLVDSSKRVQDDERHQESLSTSKDSSGKKHKKRKRGEDMQDLMDRFKIAPVRKGLSERKKKFLQEKKKKNKRAEHFHTNEDNASLHQQEIIKFGDVVDAPPKISSLPKKPTNISVERVRQQAVEAYRQKKNWASRPGSHQPPALVNVAALSS